MEYTGGGHRGILIRHFTQKVVSARMNWLSHWQHWRNLQVSTLVVHVRRLSLENWINRAYTQYYHHGS